VREQRTENREQRKQGLVFVISGPSGSGKTTLLEKVIKAKGLKNKVAKSISLTTRPRRSGERNAREYFFITKQQFRQKQRAKKILERTRYLGYDYATPRDFLEKQLKKGRHVVLCLDLKGAAKLKRLYAPGVTTIFVLPPSLAELRQRISKRCNRTKHEEIQQRLGLARREIASAAGYDYCLVNKDLAGVAGKLKQIILKKIKTQEKGTR
jgi:guanylate kinase